MLRYSLCWPYFSVGPSIIFVIHVSTSPFCYADQKYLQFYQIMFALVSFPKMISGSFLLVSWQIIGHTFYHLSYWRTVSQPSAQKEQTSWWCKNVELPSSFQRFSFIGSFIEIVLFLRLKIVAFVQSLKSFRQLCATEKMTNTFLGHNSSACCQPDTKQKLWLGLGGFILRL